MSLTIPLAQAVLNTVVHGAAWTVIPDVYLAAIGELAGTTEPPYNLTTTYARIPITFDAPVLGTEPYAVSPQQWQARAVVPTWAWHQTYADINPAFSLHIIGCFDSPDRGAGTFLGDVGSTPHSVEFPTGGIFGPQEAEVALAPSGYDDTWFFAGIKRKLEDTTINDPVLIDILNAVYRGGSLTPHTLTHIGLLTASDTEVSWSGYARQPVTFGSPTSGAQCLNTNEITFVVPPSAVGTTLRWGAYEASSGGDPVFVSTLGSHGNIAFYHNIYDWFAGSLRIQVL